LRKEGRIKMYRITVETSLGPEQVVRQAVKFFGPDGIGLRINDQDSTGARFEAKLGFVAVDVSPEDKGSSVEITTEELEYEVKKFLALLPHSTEKKVKVKGVTFTNRARA
jgi:hypothetical protein